jgi:hypothetical protein
MLKNRTPYGAERSWVRDAEGNHLWIVTVKATFRFDDAGQVTLDDEQPAPRFTPEYFGDPGRSSLRYDAEMVAPKPTTDVLLNAQAYAPHQKAAKAVYVGVRAGEIHKRLMVHGPRVYENTLGRVAISEAKPFVSCPLLYEYAFGGAYLGDADPKRQVISPNNPVGCGIARTTSELVDQPAHRIEYLDSRSNLPNPAGLGAISPDWSPRREKAGTYDATWSRDRAPLLPRDYDDGFLNAAPEDQRPTNHFRGGEVVELENLSPTGHVRFVLPRVYPTFTTHIGPTRHEHRARLGTVIIEPDERRLSLLFQTSLLVGTFQVDYLDATVIREKRYLE